MQEQIMQALITGLGASEVVLFLIGMTSLTLPVQKKHGALAAQCLIAVGITFIIAAGYHLVADSFALSLVAVSETIVSPLEMIGLYMVITLLQILAYVVIAVLGLLTIQSLFEGTTRIKIFITSLFLLLEEAVGDFISDISEYPFCSASEEQQCMVLNQPWISVILLALWLLLALFCYRKLFEEKMKWLLGFAEEQVGTAAFVTLASYFLFQVVKQTMATFGMDFKAIDPGSLLVAIIVLLSLLVIYAIMYWSIFRSIVVGAGSAKVKAELDIAGHIQASALPSVFPAFPKRHDFDIYASMHPAKEVGGDFYDFFLIDDDHLAVLIADVSGKGVPAALFMMSGRAIIRNQAMLGIEPGRIFRNANNQLAENNKEGMFITAFFGIIDLKTGVFTYSNAGHNVPFLCQPDGRVDKLNIKPGFVLAGLKNIRYKTDQVTLVPGEKLVLYTDGVTEAIDPNTKMYTEKRLIQTLTGVSHKSVQTIVAEINDSVNAFAGTAEQFDDITVLVVERKEKPIPLSAETA